MQELGRQVSYHPQELEWIWRNFPVTSTDIARTLGCSKALVAKRIRFVTTEEERIERLRLTRKTNSANSGGYVVVIAPPWWRGTQIGTNSAREHEVVWCQAHHRKWVPIGMVIHHCDNDKTNNHIDNLWLMTHQAHNKLHALERRLQHVSD